MPEGITPLSPPMEGKGSYNRYAKLPAGGAALALPFLEKAAQNVLIERRDGPIVIADYGSSQGKNSRSDGRRDPHLADAHWEKSADHGVPCRSIEERLQLAF